MQTIYVEPGSVSRETYTAVVLYKRTEPYSLAKDELSAWYDKEVSKAMHHLPPARAEITKAVKFNAKSLDWARNGGTDPYRVIIQTWIERMSPEGVEVIDYKEY